MNESWKLKLKKGDLIDVFQRYDKVWYQAEVVGFSNRDTLHWVSLDEKWKGHFPRNQYGQFCKPFHLENRKKKQTPVKELEWIKGIKSGELLDAAINPSTWMLAELRRREDTGKGSYSYVVQFVENRNIMSRDITQIALPFTRSASSPISAPVSQSVPFSSVVNQNKVQSSVRINGGWNVRELKVNDFLDVRDRENVWLEGYIVKIDDARNRVQVHFLGWDKKWDEWIYRHENRFARIQGKGRIVKDRKLPSRPRILVPDDFKSLITRNMPQNQAKELSDLVKQCCKIEDEVSSTMLKTPTQAHKDREKLRKEIQKLESRLKQAQSHGVRDENHAMAFKMCENVLSSLSDTIKQLENQVFSQKMQIEEKKLMQSLDLKFHIVDIAKDGNCLFSAFGHGWEHSKGSVKNLSKNPKDPERQKIAKLYREKAVEEMKNNKQYHEAMILEIKNAHSKKKGNVAGDTPMYEQIRSFLEKKYPKQDIPFDKKEVLEVYCQAMLREGIYGTDIELKALSEQFRSPIHVYHARGSKGAPHIVGAEYSNSRPICLVFSIAGKHYNLMIPLDAEGYFRQYKPSTNSIEIDDELVGPGDIIHSEGKSEHKNSAEEKGHDKVRPEQFSPQESNLDKSSGNPPPDLSSQSLPPYQGINGDVNSSSNRKQDPQLNG